MENTIRVKIKSLNELVNDGFTIDINRIGNLDIFKGSSFECIITPETYHKIKNKIYSVNINSSEYYRIEGIPLAKCLFNVIPTKKYIQIVSKENLLDSLMKTDSSFNINRCGRNNMYIEMFDHNGNIYIIRDIDPILGKKFEISNCVRNVRDEISFFDLVGVKDSIYLHKTMYEIIEE